MGRACEELRPNALQTSGNCFPSREQPLRMVDKPFGFFGIPECVQQVQQAVTAPILAPTG